MAKLILHPTTQSEPFSDWLRAQRRSRNLSQKTLGESVGYSQSYISDIEGGKKPSQEFERVVREFFDQGSS